MSIWTPPVTIPALNDGDPLVAKTLKDLVASLQAFLNGEIGNVNILEPLDPTDKIEYEKLDLAGKIQASDIVGISFSSFTSLQVKAQLAPNNTVQVLPGNYLSLDGTQTRFYAGGNSAAFPNTSGVGMNRIDVLSITDGGVLGISPGIEGGAPVPPAYPTEVIPLAEIYIRYSATGVVIKDADDLTNSYISRDARSLLKPTGLPDNSVTNAKLVDYTIGNKKLNYREQESTHIANALGVTYSPRPIRVKAITNADAQPCGHGAVRGSKVYFACRNRDYVAEWDHLTDTLTLINLTAGDAPCCVVKIGTNLYVLCETALSIKKIDQANAVTQLIDLKTQGPASDVGWTLANALTPNSDGTILYTLVKIGGTPVSRLLRVVMATPAVTHAWDFGAGNALMNPQFIRGADGTEYVVCHGLNAGVCSLERRFASDLTAAGSFALAAGDTTFLGSDGCFCYVWDNTNSNVRVIDCSIATMADVGRFTLNQVAGAANEVTSRVFLSTTGGENHYPYFTGRSLLLPPNINRPAIMTAIPVPNWGGAYQVLVTNAGGTVSANGFACDGEYNFVAISDGIATGAAIARILA
jgi:hypothetical protein